MESPSAGKAPEITLKVSRGPSQGKAFTLSSHDGIIIGRSRSAHIRLVEDQQISRHHFLLEVKPPRVRLVNLSQTNGTFVNGCQTDVADLSDGDQIVAGNSEFEVLIQARPTDAHGPVEQAVPVPPGSPQVSSPAPGPDVEDARETLPADGQVLIDPSPPPVAEPVPAPAPVPPANLPAAPPPPPVAEAKDEDIFATLPSDGGGAGAGPQSPPRPLPVAIPADEEDDIYATLPSDGGAGLPGQAPPQPGPFTSPGPEAVPVPAVPIPLQEENAAAKLPALPAEDLESPTEPKPEPKSPEDSETIARYKTLRVLGEGGMGSVFLAIDSNTSEKVALKVIVPEKLPSEKDAQVFLREAEILGKLKHPNIVRFIDFGRWENTIYIAMEYVEGTDGESLVKESGGFLPVGRAVNLGCQLLGALDFAHGLSFVHRDIKPSNLLIREEEGKEEAKLIDFGLARIYQDTRVSGLSMTGDVHGSPGFLAPEQITQFKESRPPADIYAAGATIYFLLTGDYVFDFPARLGQQLLMVLEKDPVPIRERRDDIPEELESIIHQALQKEPANRYCSAGEFREKLLPFIG